MTVWDLPGPKRFIESIRYAIAHGSNVVVRFLGTPPQGFDDALMDALGSTFRHVDLAVTDSPFRDLSRAISAGTKPFNSIEELLEDEKFRGALVHLHGINQTKWNSWRTFLTQYSEAIRGISVLGRSLFCVVLTGLPPCDFPTPDVTLTNREWDGALDEMDLLIFASEHLHDTIPSIPLRNLLAATISRVAVWDLYTAKVLLEKSEIEILDPLVVLQQIAVERGWTDQTPLDWRIGTVSQKSSVHPARAAIDNPPNEIVRRIWSAQIAQIMPLIEEQRYALVKEHEPDIRYRMRRSNMDDSDPYGLELGDLARIVTDVSTNRNLRRSIYSLRNVRNDLAHLKPLEPERILNVLREAS